jgi:hypothetical protein
MTPLSRDIAASRDMGEWRLGEVDLPVAASHPCAIFLLGGKAAALHVIGATEEGLSDDFNNAGRYKIQVAARCVAAKVSIQPLYDPRSARVCS